MAVAHSYCTYNHKSPSTFHPLAESQWGSLHGKSTVTGLLTTTYNWLNVLEGGGEISAIFFNLRKAFDLIPQEAELEKIKKKLDCVA